ncbi:MAG: ABC transporter substrate-binding protein [Bacteroidota bacterium]
MSTPRIVSLLPSATEIVCALGLADRLVGVTHECDWPPEVAGLPVVTRSRIPADASSAEIDALVREQLQTEAALYTLDEEALAALAPDLLVTQALCDVCAVAEAEVAAAACRLPGSPRVLNLEPMTLAEVLGSIRAVGDATGVDATPVVAALEARIRAVAAAVARRSRPRVAMVEWLDPPFSAGHWNPELVHLAGGTEVLGRTGTASRTLQWEEVVAAQPEVVVVACCGFEIPRALEDIGVLDAVEGWATVPAARDGRVFVVDGSGLFARPGPRLVESVELLAHLLHPDAAPMPAGVAVPVRLEPVGTSYIERD